MHVRRCICCILVRSVFHAFDDLYVLCTFIASRSGARHRLPLYHNVSTNAAPSNGSCDVTPRLGYANETLFNVTCYNYTDIDLPINYTLEIEYEGMRIFKHISSLQQNLHTYQLLRYFTFTKRISLKQLSLD